ncbi:MAG: glycosyltransferase family 2 protein [Hyphomicrobiaceae bacterium]|nr:glycosyltransferase family 2 protein [Hyphomicrobiaceae bacterium]
MSGPVRLSIGLPVYNGEALLEETLASLLRQTFADFEIIILDNASTDRTPVIAASAAARDARVRYVRNERNIGANANFTRAAELATAPLFKWAAHDDLYAPTYLQRCIDALDGDPGVVLAHADAVFIDEWGAPFRNGARAGAWIEPATGATYTADPPDLAESARPFVRFGHVVFGSLWGTHMFGVIRREALSRTRLIQNVPSADRPLLAELALLGRFQTVREPLFLKRFHSRMTLALSEHEIRAYVSADSAEYSKRLRQLSIFLATPHRKPIGWLQRLACRGMVLAYAGKVFLRTSRGVTHQAIRPAGPGTRQTSTSGL